MAYTTACTAVQAMVTFMFVELYKLFFEC